MKIETIHYLERKNLGNYEHIELSASARIEDGEAPLASMKALKDLVHAALNEKALEIQDSRKPAGIKADEAIRHEEAKAKLEAAAIALEAEKTAKAEEAKKEKKPRGKKDAAASQTPATTEEAAQENILPSGQEVPAEIKEEKAKYTPYNRGVDAHKGMLSAHLTKTFPLWKQAHTKQKIIDFTSSLNGKDFLDADGNIVPSFQKLLAEFFG